jgi:four helix bundle protein
LPKEERFNIIDQANRSSSSVPDNISEGYNAYYYKDKVHRFYDARKEAAETQNHILKMERKGYITEVISKKITDRYQLLIRGINAYINYINKKFSNRK